MIGGTETSEGGDGCHTPLDGILIALCCHMATTTSLLAIQPPYMNGCTIQGMVLQSITTPVSVCGQQLYYVKCHTHSWIVRWRRDSRQTLLTEENTK